MRLPNTARTYTLSSFTARAIIHARARARHVYEDKDPNDKRFIKIYPLGGGGKNFIQIEDENKKQAKFTDRREEYFNKPAEEEDFDLDKFFEPSEDPDDRR